MKVFLDINVVLASVSPRGVDYEDDLQIACAVAAGVDLLVTRNVRDFAHAPLRVADPAEAAQLIAAPAGR